MCLMRAWLPIRVSCNHWAKNPHSYGLMILLHTIFLLKCWTLKCHDFSALADYVSKIKVSIDSMGIQPMSFFGGLYIILLLFFYFFLQDIFNNFWYHEIIVICFFLFTCAQQQEFVTYILWRFVIYTSVWGVPFCDFLMWTKVFIKDNKISWNVSTWMGCHYIAWKSCSFSHAHQDMSQNSSLLYTVNLLTSEKKYWMKVNINSIVLTLLFPLTKRKRRSGIR